MELSRRLLSCMILVAVFLVGCGDSADLPVEEYIRPIKTVTIGKDVPSVDQRRFPGRVQAVD